MSVCSLKRELKVTQFCAGLQELINIYKLTMFNPCFINGLWGTKLNAIVDAGQTDRRTDRWFFANS